MGKAGAGLGQIHLPVCVAMAGLLGTVGHDDPLR